MAQHRSTGGQQASDVFVAALAGPTQAFLPPLEFCRGVIPSQAAKNRKTASWRCPALTASFAGTTKMTTF
jgi:hypothetical protein